MDAWAEERLLSRHLALEGVIMSTGEQYHGPEPGRFRLIFAVSEETLCEGIRKYVIFAMPRNLEKAGANSKVTEYPLF